MRRGAYCVMKMATPRATGIARTKAKVDTSTVTCNRLKIPNRIAEVFVVTHLPP
ncbi:Uncharacterised protein [Mycobacterium tuberculosis]|nr:Uncharacterised protein [Mycobacterium tuberculosis]